MCLPAGNEPIAPDEIVYRRIPVSTNWYSGNELSPNAFEPRDDDTTGLSFTRAKYKTLEEAGHGASKKGYLVAVLPASEILSLGLHIEPKPIPENIGHCEIPEIRVETRDDDRTIQFEMDLAKMAERDIRGPFINRPPQQPS